MGKKSSVEVPAENAVKLADVLHTQDEKEQIAVVGNLVQLANAPIVIMTVALDTRTGKTDILLNGTYSFEEIYTLLDVARRELMRRERGELLKQSENQS